MSRIGPQTRIAPALADMLGILCPMHVVIGATGHVVHLGPTARRLFPDNGAPGRRFLELVELKRPRLGGSMAELCAISGARLHLKLRQAPHTDLKGVLVRLPATVLRGGGAVINLSFGLSLIDAVQDFSLSNADFAATDLAMEMLYLVEAKSAAMEASHNLNLRLQGARIAAEEQAFTDTLTGLKNRRALDHVLSRLIAMRSDFALMNVDLDFFKRVNDTLGHAAGDFVLQEVARIMVALTREADTVVRNGGDEFVIILHGVTDPEKLHETARRLIERIEQPTRYQGETCQISASIGAALSAYYRDVTLPAIMADADAALYAAKAAGRGQARVHRVDSAG